ncbi:hypothetical protein BOSE62_140005 [Bosea sp. 62]|nr:hypothetical protein BOSE7B_150005 [Bosea sp. 7B]CAD5271919.1 hypothetical protein BOSE21B_20062 [Bosea sp. 21B]CAD5274129.1 hypothetical protein BOSE46_20358 [Bosea sp. 46]VVT56281.1 hypothetical protein BOS5A_140062 [Bosea sp. EC-HK365B]VXB62178.1 hypothetical protein BOSE62_140005 [Bosea sp. 62]VXC08218.1 hypothetical protein BOSE29B_20059 [Bosea sp. 29B]VXC27401.1 hypothetical protein BOSE127_180005 [Bosea sp. 127]
MSGTTSFLSIQVWSFDCRNDSIWWRGQPARHLSATALGCRLDLFRLVGAALLHPRHHLRLRALLRLGPGERCGGRAGALGLCDRSCRARHRAALAAARWHRRQDRPSQAMDRRVRRHAGRGLGDALVRQAGFALGGADRSRRLRHRHDRCRVRDDLQQCDDDAVGAAGAARTALRHRLGRRLSRRVGLAHADARLPRRRSAHWQDPGWPVAAVWTRCCRSRGRPLLGAAHRALVRDLRHPDVLADAGLAADRHSAEGGGCRRLLASQGDDRRIALAARAWPLPAREHDLSGRAGRALCLRRHLWGRRLRLADDRAGCLRHPAHRHRHARGLGRRQARRCDRRQASDPRRDSLPALRLHRHPLARAGTGRLRHRGRAGNTRRRTLRLAAGEGLSRIGAADRLGRRPVAGVFAQPARPHRAARPDRRVLRPVRIGREGDLVPGADAGRAGDDRFCEPARGPGGADRLLPDWGVADRWGEGEAPVGSLDTAADAGWQQVRYRVRKGELKAWLAREGCDADRGDGRARRAGRPAEASGDRRQSRRAAGRAEMV